MSDEYVFDKVSIRLIKESPLLSETPIDSPEKAISLLGEILSDVDREVLCVINLQTDGRPINCNIVSIGGVNMSIACPSELMKSAILSNASSMIILHNHPSGRLSPSAEDRLVTDKMTAICGLMGIPLRDHIIVGGDNSHYYSFKKEGVLENTEMRCRVIAERNGYDGLVQEMIHKEPEETGKHKR